MARLEAYHQGLNVFIGSAIQAVGLFAFPTQGWSHWDYEQGHWQQSGSHSFRRCWSGWSNQEAGSWHGWTDSPRQEAQWLVSGNWQADCCSRCHFAIPYCSGSTAADWLGCCSVGSSHLGWQSSSSYAGFVSAADGADHCFDPVWQEASTWMTRSRWAILRDGARFCFDAFTDLVPLGCLDSSLGGSHPITLCPPLRAQGGRCKIGLPFWVGGKDWQPLLRCGWSLCFGSRPCSSWVSSFPRCGLCWLWLLLSALWWGSSPWPYASGWFHKSVRASTERRTLFGSWRRNLAFQWDTIVDPHSTILCSSPLSLGDHAEPTNQSPFWCPGSLP